MKPLSEVVRDMRAAHDNGGARFTDLRDWVAATTNHLARLEALASTWQHHAEHCRLPPHPTHAIATCFETCIGGLRALLSPRSDEQAQSRVEQLARVYIRVCLANPTREQGAVAYVALRDAVLREGDEQVDWADEHQGNPEARRIAEAKAAREAFDSLQSDLAQARARIEELEDLAGKRVEDWQQQSADVITGLTQRAEAAEAKVAELAELALPPREGT